MEDVIKLIVVFVLVISIYLHIESKKTDLIYVKSRIDGNQYLVRNVEDKEDCADLISRIRQKLEKVTRYLDQKYPTQSKVKRLKPIEVTTQSSSSLPGEDGTIMSNGSIVSALLDGLNQISNKIQEKFDLASLILFSSVAIKKVYDAFDDDPENLAGSQPELEPVGAPVDAKPKRTKKITKEAIEAMVQNMLKESLK